MARSPTEPKAAVAPACIPMSATATRPAPLAATGAPEHLRAAFNRALRSAAVRSAFGAPEVTVETVQETGSTNADLLARAREAAPAEGATWVRCALAQRAGRGRLGRRWFTAPGSALLFSVAVPLHGAELPVGVTLAVGVALADELTALASFAGVVLPDDAIQLKWPNDLLLATQGMRAKLGGVLTELAVDRAGGRTLVVGVGINLWLDAAARGSIGQPAAALDAVLPLETLGSEREYWLGRLAAAVASAVRETEAHGFVPRQSHFMRRFADLNQPVEVREQGARIAQGRALGVDGEGRLLVDVDGRVRSFASGDISVRAMETAR